MSDERRDYARRAETTHAVVECLTRHTDGISIQTLAGVFTVPAAAAERIVKRLAIRGLVREAWPGGWRATPPLVHPSEVIQDRATPALIADD